MIVSPGGRIAVVSQSGTSWSLPKGHVEDGESLLGAARREIREETGLEDPTLIGELHTYERGSIRDDGSIDDSIRKRITLFLFTAPQVALIPSDPNNPAAQWLPPEEAADLLTHPADRAALLSALPAAAAAAAGARHSSDLTTIDPPPRQPARPSA